MANNYIDPTEKGIEGLKGINRLGYDPTTSGGLPLSNEEAALLGTLNKKFSDYDDSSLYYNPQAVPDMGWGDSVYDDNAYIGNLDYDVIQNRRADLQGAGVQLLNGILKGVATAGTTIADSIVGLPVGIIKAFAQGDVSKLWDNEVTQGTKALSDQLEKSLPNYRSVEEEEAPFWENLDTANFWGDTIIKNAGFMLGAYYGGLPAAKIGQVLTLGAVKSAKFFNATQKAIENTVKAGNYITKGLHAGTSAVVEGSIEAKNNSADWYNLQKAKTDDYYAQALEELDSTYLKGTPEYEEAFQGIAQAYNNSLQELDQKRKQMGNMDLFLNIPILTMSNIIQFAKILGGGFTTGVKGGLNIKGTLGNFRTSLGKHSYLKSGIKNALAEGTEEMSQKIASDFSGNLRGAEYTNYAIDEFRNAKVDVNASKESTDAVTSLGNAVYNNLTDVKSWEEFFVGALFGAVGMPQFGIKDNGKFGFKGMGGGIWNEYKENAEKLKQEQELVDYLNTRGAKELKETWHGLVRNKYYEDQKQKAIANKDEKAYHDANQKQAISDVIMFGKAGKLELLEAQLDDLGKSAENDKFIDDLLEETKVTVTVDQQKQEIDQQIQQIQEEELQDQFVLQTLLSKKESLEKRIKKQEELLNAETNPDRKNLLERELESINQEYQNFNEEYKRASLSISNNTSMRENSIEELERSKEYLEEYTFGPFMQGDTPMSKKDIRDKVKSKIKETKALIDIYKQNSEELQKDFQGKLTREQEETLIFLKLQQEGNKKRIIDIIKSLDNVRDNIIPGLKNNLREAEEALNEAKNQGKSEEEIKKLEESYQNIQFTLNTFNSLFYDYDESSGGKKAEELDTIKLEFIGFTEILSTLLAQFKTKEGYTIFGRPANEILEGLQKKSKDIEELIKETNLYEKKYTEYKKNPQNINQDRDSIEQEKAEAKRKGDLDELKDALHNGNRKEKAEFADEYDGTHEGEPEVEEGLTQEESQHLSQARFDNAVTKNLLNKATDLLLSNTPSQEVLKILDTIIKDIVCADIALNRTEIENLLSTKGQELLNEFTKNPDSFKEGETLDSLAQKILDFFGNLDLNKEQNEMREFFAKEAKSEAERIKKEEKESKDLAERMSTAPEEDSAEPSRNPKDGPEDDAALEPPKGVVTSATGLTTDKETSTATAYSDKKSAKEINFESPKGQSFMGKRIKGLKPFFSFYYQHKGPMITYIEALEQDLEQSAKDSSRGLQLLFKIADQFFDQLKKKTDDNKDFINRDELLTEARDPKNTNLEKLLQKSAYYNHIGFLHNIYIKLGIQDNVKHLKAKDKLIIRAYEYDNRYGIIPIIYKVETDPNTNKVIEIPVGIAITELQLNTESKFDKNKLLKDAYPEAAKIVEFLENNKEGYLETKVNEVYGGTMALSEDEVSVSKLYENNGTPKLGIITSTTSSNEESQFEGNSAAKENTLSVSNAKQGQVYVLVESPFGNFIPALAVPRSLSNILKNSKDPLCKELIKRITDIFKTSKDPAELKERLKDYIYLPGLKIEYDSNTKQYKFIYSKKLTFNNTDKVSKVVNLNIDEINESKVESFLNELLKNTEYKDTLTININVNKIDFNNSSHKDYIDFISQFLSVNLSSTTTINDWYSFNTPKEIKGTVNNNTPAIPNNSNPNNPVSTDPDGGNVDYTGNVTNNNGNTVNDNKEVKEQQDKALNNADSNRVIINENPLSKNFNLPDVSQQFGQTNTTSDSSTADNDNASNDDIDDDDLGEIEDDEYHSGIYRKVTKGSILSNYFERQKNKVLNMKPQSSSQVPKNLNNIEKENFNSCQ